MAHSDRTGDGCGIGTSSTGLPEINGIFHTIFDPVGLEFHPFQVGWYNELVGPKFILDFPPSTLAYVAISGPDTFEKSVLPYLRSEFKTDPNVHTNDPLDDAMVHSFQVAKKELKSAGFQTEVYHDFDLYPSRRPKILVQTAAHVAGAVQYFHKTNLPQIIQEKHFSKASDLCGVAIHPKYGGWFAIRGVFILQDVVLKPEEELIRPRPLNLIPEVERIVKLLESFAYNWQKEEWRKIYRGDGVEYSNDFKDFLAVLPGQRWEFIKNRGFLQDDAI